MSRREHQCHYDGCDSEAEFEVRFRVLTEDRGRGAIPFDCASSLKMCNAHRTKAAELILSEGNRANFMKTLWDAGVNEDIDWSTARVEYVPLPKGAPVIVNLTRPIVQCDYGDSKARCVLPAKYQVALKVFRYGSTTTGADLATNTCVCLKHKSLLKPEHVLSPETKSRLLGELSKRGFPLPDFKRTQLRFHELDEGRRLDPAQFVRK